MAGQSFVLGVTQICIALTVNCLIVLTARTLAVFLARRPLWMRLQKAFMGAVLGGLAIRMATDRSRAVAAP